MKGYDVIHAGNTVASYVVGLTKSFIDSKILYDVHSNVVAESRLHRTGIFDPLGNFLIFEALIMEQIAVRRADFFITNSESLMHHYIQNGIDQDRIEVIYNGVDTGLFKPAKRRLKNENFTVTYAGGFQKWQSIDILVNAMRLLEGTEIRLKMIGFTEKDLNLKKKIKQSLGHSVELIDYLPRTKLIYQLQKSDILIIPRAHMKRKDKPFPTKFAENIAVGKPVIITKLDEPSKFIEKYDYGFVCEATSESIAKTIVKAKETSPKILFRKGMNGRRLAEVEFDQWMINKKYLEFLSRIARV